MLRDYDNGGVESCAGAQAVKRSGRHCDLEQQQSFVKRLKKEVTGTWWNVSSSYEHRVDAGMGFLTPEMTPAATPAEPGATAMPATTSSPYSEAEDYMVRGYYEDDLVYNNRACVESVQYNLYDMTPEELEHANEDSRHDNNHQIGSATWSSTTANWQQQQCSAEVRCAANETVYEDSYDIDM